MTKTRQFRVRLASFTNLINSCIRYKLANTNTKTPRFYHSLSEPLNENVGILEIYVSRLSVEKLMCRVSSIRGGGGKEWGMPWSTLAE